MLTQRQKGKVRQQAASHWNSSMRHVVHGGDADRIAAEKLRLIRLIESRREEIFGTSIIASILGPILMQMAIKLAVRLLEKWIEDRMLSGVVQGTVFRRGER